MGEFVFEIAPHPQHAGHWLLKSNQHFESVSGRYRVLIEQRGDGGLVVRIEPFEPVSGLKNVVAHPAGPLQERKLLG